MKRVRNGATEPVMTERVMERVMEPVMQAMQEIKRLIESKQSAPADCNGNPRTSLDQVETSEGRGYQLLFANKLPSTIFTDSKIEAEIGGPVKIVLIDTISTAPVTTGPLSSTKIQIIVLDGDFGFEAQENWTKQDFNDKVVHERDGKRPLVTGELNIMLRDGVGIISDLSFTDNSSWIKCRKFRLGARVVQSIGGHVRIKEAISEAFVVKDHRTKKYVKHHPPSLDDKVWRLEKIRKDGKFHQQLASHQIDTVKDFMRMYVTEPTKLREMLDCPEGAWNTIVEHASTCDVNDEISFTYSVDGIGLLFNSVYKLVAAAIDGHNYQSVDDPTFTHKPLVKSIKEQAYRNVSSFVPVDGRAIFGPSKSLPTLQDEPISGSTTDFSGMHFDCHLPSTSSSYMGGLENHSHQLQLPVAQNTHQMFGNYNFELDELFSPSNEQSVLNFSNATTSSPSTPRLENHSHQLPLPIPQTFDYNLVMDEFFPPSNDEIVPNIASEMTSQAPMSTWSPVNATWEHNNGFYLTSTSNDSEFGHIANTHGMQIVHGRDGKRSRLTGELNITLRDGIGIINDLSFTDNFNWIKSRKFRLGARVVQSLGGQVSIKEAISEAFVVKDHRAEIGTEMEREIQDMNREMQELKADLIREIQELKADRIREMQEMKEYMQRLVRSSSAECNENARCSLDYSQLNNHFMTESCQPYNSPTTGSLLNQFQVLHQAGSAGMQNDCNYASSEIVQTHVNDQLTLSNDNHQPRNNGDSGWNSPQSNEHDFLQLSPNTRLMIGSSQNNNGPLLHFSASQNNQNTVMSPGTITFCNTWSH